jgi:hypothetical protein
MPFPTPASGMVNIMIAITGISDRDRPEWMIAINGIRNQTSRRITTGRSSSWSATPGLIGSIRRFQRGQLSDRSRLVHFLLVRSDETI